MHAFRCAARSRDSHWSGSSSRAAKSSPPRLPGVYSSPRQAHWWVHVWAAPASRESKPAVYGRSSIKVALSSCFQTGLERNSCSTPCIRRAICPQRRSRHLLISWSSFSKSTTCRTGSHDVALYGHINLPAGRVLVVSASVISFAPGSAAVPRAMPAWVYNNAEMTRLELERILRPSWQLVCHVSSIPNPGDFITFDLGSDSVIVIRDRQSAVRAFY